MGRPPGNPWRMVQFWHFFFPAKEGGCLVLETISLDHRNKPTGLFEFWSAIHRSRPKVFSRAILFHFDAKFWYYVVGVHNSPREGLFVINLMPFTQGLWMAFVCHEKQFLRGVPRVDPITSKIFGILRHIFPSVTFLRPLVFTAMRSLPSWRFWTSIQRKVKELHSQVVFFCILFNEISVKSKCNKKDLTPSVSFALYKWWAIVWHSLARENILPWRWTCP